MGLIGPSEIHRDTAMIGSNNFPPCMYSRLQREIFVGLLVFNSTKQLNCTLVRKGVCRY